MKRRPTIYRIGIRSGDLDPLTRLSSANIDPGVALNSYFLALGIRIYLITLFVGLGPILLRIS